MKNAMQLKAILKNMAKQKNISAQLVLQNYMLERLLERVSVSKYRNNFILKGGFLIAAMWCCQRLSTKSETSGTPIRYARRWTNARTASSILP